MGASASSHAPLTVCSMAQARMAMVFIACVFAALGVVETSATPVSDDRALHIAAGVGTAIIAGGASAIALRPWDTCDGAYFCGRRPTWGGTFGVAAVATGASLTFGGAKEIADMLGFGTASISDMTWTALGGLSAALAVSSFVAHVGNNSNALTLATGSVAAGFLFTLPVQRNLVTRVH